MKDTAGEVIYVVGVKWWTWVFVAAVLVGLIWFLRPIVERSPHGNLTYLLLIYPVLVVVPRLLIKKTWLTAKGIHHRSGIGKTTFVPYDAIEEFAYSRRMLTVKYSGGGALRLNGYKSSLEPVVRLSRKFGRPGVRVAGI